MAGRKGSLIDPDPYPLLHTPGISISGAPLSVSWQDTETQPSPHPQHGLCRVMGHIQYIHGSTCTLLDEPDLSRLIPRSETDHKLKPIMQLWPHSQATITCI